MDLFNHHPPHFLWTRCLLLMTLALFAVKNTQAQVIGGNLTATEGDTVILHCKMTERVKTLSQISWKRTPRKNPLNEFFYTISERNGPSFTNGPDPRITFIGDFSERDGTLQMTNVSLEDEGKYSCVFTLFPAGSFEMDIPLRVLVPPFTSLNYNPQILGNEEVLLATCTAAGARPPADVSLFLQGKDLRNTTTSTDHDNRTTTTVSSLFGVPTRGLNDQKVECIVSSPAWSRPHNKSFVVQVFFPPMNVTAVERSDQTIECVSEGNPKPSFTWTRPDKTLPASDFRVDGGNLTFLKWATDLKGLYECEISNPYGKQSFHLYLAVAPGSNPAPWVLFGLLFCLNVIAAVWYFHNRGYFFKRIEGNAGARNVAMRVATESDSPEETRQ